jgi:hypothetical protein
MSFSMKDLMGPDSFVERRPGRAGPTVIAAIDGLALDS